MRIGFVGLGRMGAKMTERLLRGGHEIAVYDKNTDGVKEIQKSQCPDFSNARSANAEKAHCPQAPTLLVLWLPLTAIAYRNHPPRPVISYVSPF